MKPFIASIRSFIAAHLVLTMLLIGLTAGLVGFAGVRALTNKPAATQCQGICVALREDGMYPNELAVKRGELVQFNSADGQSHNISEGDGAHGDDHAHEHVGDYLSGEFGPDEAWRVQFNKAGTYKLHDHYNPKQSILVVVYEEQ